MADIRILEAKSSGSASSVQPADNPFYQASKFHPTEKGEDCTSSWLIEGFPGVGAAIISGNCNFLEGDITKHVEFRVSIKQGHHYVEELFFIGYRRLNRYGLTFVNDGSPYLLTFKAVAHGYTSQSLAIEVGPLELRVPIPESSRPKLTRMLDNGQSVLVSCNQGGLMNRIIPLMSMMYVARRCGKSVYVWWGANNHCAAEISDLFDLGDEAESKMNFSFEDFDQYNNYEHTAPFNLESPKDTLVHSISPIRTVNPTVVNGYKQAGEEYKCLKLAKPVYDKLAPFEQVNFNNTIGFHIRRPYPNGQFAEQENAKFTLGIDVFIDLISKLRYSLPEFQRVLLCTNSEQAESELKKIFGDYLIVFNKTSIDNTSDRVAVQEALVDLELMSRCRVLFSQETTAFGTFSHSIGNNLLLSVTQSTNADQFHFYVWEEALHTQTFATPRNDISELVARVRDKLSPT